MSLTIPKPVSGNKRLVVTGRIRSGYPTIESKYDTAMGDHPRAAGLPVWNPVFPEQPKGWRDDDLIRKQRIEDRAGEDI